MIQLDSLILPDLVWTDRYSHSGVESQVEKTLSGRPIIWEQSTQGQPITLEGGSDTAWILKSDLDILYAMTKIPNAYYELSFEGVLYTVRFRNEEPPCIEASPLVGRPNQAAGDYFNNLGIKLMIV